MKISEADILVVPGLGGAPQGHWQFNWAQKMPTARIVEQTSWHEPALAEWVENLHREVIHATRPVVLVGHGLGVCTIVHLARHLTDTRVAGAFVVAAPDLDQHENIPSRIKGFAPVPRARLPFRSSLIASSNDPYCSLEAAADMAAAWGSHFSNAGQVGNLDQAAGFGAWPEGLLAFANLMKRL